MPQYKISYFNIRGRAELPRLILVKNGVEFEDFRVDYDKDWPAFKAKATREYSLILLFISFKYSDQSSKGARTHLKRAFQACQIKCFFIFLKRRKLIE